MPSNEHVSETFIKSSFANESFSSCEFEDCTFDHCDLSLAAFTNCTFKGRIHFKECKLIGVDFSKSTFSLLAEIVFEKSLLEACNFSWVKLPNANFAQSMLRKSIFAETDLRSANFSQCDLEETLFRQCTLEGADFRRAKNYHINVTANAIKGAKFSYPDALDLLSALDIAIEY